MLSTSTIDQIRERTDLVQLVGESVQLKRQGNRWFGLCFIHNEKTASFCVQGDRYFCHGCKASGDAFEFLQKRDGLTFIEAVQLLAERAGIELEETKERSSDYERHRKRLDEMYAVNDIAARFFAEQMLSSEAAQGHLQERGLELSACADFQLGYVGGDWTGLSVRLRDGGASISIAEMLGLVAKRDSGGYYDRFRNRLMFPIRDFHGKVVAFSGRTLVDDRAKYINSPESAIYRKGDNLFGLWQARKAIADADRCIVVEGNFDVASMHARGVRNVVAPLGTAFTEAQAKLIKRFTERVTFMFDSDAAGVKATKAAASVCANVALKAQVAQCGQHKDPDELAQKEGAPGISEALARSIGITEWLIEDELGKPFSMSDAKERVERLDRVIAILKTEVDPLVRLLLVSYCDKVARRLGVNGPEAFKVLVRRVKNAVG